MPLQRKPPLPLLLFLVFIGVNENHCTSKRANIVSDSSQAPVDTALVLENDEPARREDSEEVASTFIHYFGAREDDRKKALREFPLFIALQELTRRSVAVQDSLETIHERYGEPLTNPADTLVLHPFKERAYQAILDYKKQMASGSVVKFRCPSLLELDRTPAAEDSSIRFLPQTKPSDLFANGNYFLLGGAPFISRFYPTDNADFTDSHGRSEIRFATSLTENAQYLLTSLACAKPGAIDIEYGAPLYTYEMGPAEVHGIGSLIHRFRQRVPVLFITEQGLVPGDLLSIRLNLADAYQCGEGDAYIELACATSLEANDILAIYIPYDSMLTSCVVDRPSAHVWTADLNNDGIADLACFSDAYAGTTDDTIVEELWFVNVNGAWRIIDWGAEPECT